MSAGATAGMRKYRPLTEGAPKWVKSTHSNRLRYDAKNQRLPIEFHIGSADLRVLEFIELASPTEVWRVA